MRRLAILFLFLPLIIAGDFHSDDETHTITYTILDSSGDPVSGQTVNLTIKSSDNVNYFDFNDSTWKSFANLTTKHRTMTEDPDGGFYFSTITIDNAFAGSGDVVIIISNDNATYSDHQAESVSFSNMNNLIKLNR